MSLGAALQLTNIARDIEEDGARGRLYVPREILDAIDVGPVDPRIIAEHPRLGDIKGRVCALATTAFAAADAALAACPSRRRLWPALAMMAIYRRVLARVVAAPPGSGRVRVPVPHPALDRAARDGAGALMTTTHVVGAGLAGLAAAVSLAQAGTRVCLYEAAPRAGGRCRSYFEPQLDCTIDNGSHVILGANDATLAYVDAIGSRDALLEVAPATIPFLDLATGDAWALRPNAGPLPWWILRDEPPRRGHARRGPSGARIHSCVAGR